MKKLELKLWIASQSAKETVKTKFMSFKNTFDEEDGGPEAIIIGIIMIIIVVALAIIFRKQLASWVNSLMGKANDELGNAAEQITGQVLTMP